MWKIPFLSLLFFFIGGSIEPFRILLLIFKLLFHFEYISFQSPGLLLLPPPKPFGTEALSSSLVFMEFMQV